MTASGRVAAGRCWPSLWRALNRVGSRQALDLGTASPAAWPRAGSGNAVFEARVPSTRASHRFEERQLKMKTRFQNAIHCGGPWAFDDMQSKWSCLIAHSGTTARLLAPLLLTGLIHSAVSLEAAVLTVTSLADSGPGTLREEITIASSGDTIQFGVTGVIGLMSS